jgi:colicin import membrane protein
LFGLGGFEITIIVLFAFLIFGPDRLPQIARTIGRVIRQFRSAQEQMNKVIKAEVYDPLKDLEPLANPFAGFSLEDSKDGADKDDAKKPGSAKTVKKADDKTAGKIADKTGDKAGAATSSSAGGTAAGAAVASTAASSEKKVSSGTLKAAISEEAGKAREKATKGATTTATAAGAGAASESFAQRRARLELEHAKAKAAREGAAATASATAPAPATAGTTASAASAPTQTAPSDQRKEDEKGA